MNVSIPETTPYIAVYSTSYFIYFDVRLCVCAFFGLEALKNDMKWLEIWLSESRLEIHSVHIYDIGATKSLARSEKYSEKLSKENTSPNMHTYIPVDFLKPTHSNKLDIQQKQMNFYGSKKHNSSTHKKDAHFKFSRSLNNILSLHFIYIFNTFILKNWNEPYA